MKYIEFLKKDLYFINKYLLELYIERININTLKKYKKLKNFSIASENRKNLSRVKTILNNFNYENFKRKSY